MEEIDESHDVIDLDIYLYIYIIIYGNRISEGLGARSPVMGVPGGHYLDFNGHLITIIESPLFPACPM